jgi:HPt (histidine-containing phosphotransfer) domain-containing protein
MEQFISRQAETGRGSSGGTPDAAGPALSIEGLDTQRGIAMTGGTPESYWAVLRIYRRDAEGRLKTLEALGDRGPDPEGLPAFITQVHALKSASASIGAVVLSAAAAELEAAGRRGDRDFIQKNLGAFCRSLGAVVDRVREALQGRAEEAGAAGEGETERLFRDLKAALEAENIEDMDRLIRDLDALPLSEPLRKIREDVSDNVLISEFSAAAAVIDAWLGSPKRGGEAVSP